MSYCLLPLCNFATKLLKQKVMFLKLNVLIYHCVVFVIKHKLTLSGISCFLFKAKLVQLGKAVLS